jgi:hypothetical protein
MDPTSLLAIVDDIENALRWPLHTELINPNIGLTAPKCVLDMGTSRLNEGIAGYRSGARLAQLFDDHPA